MTMMRQQPRTIAPLRAMGGGSARTTDPFILGNPELMRRMAFIDQLAARGADTSPVLSPMEAGIRLATGGLAGYLGRQADETVRTSREGYKKAMAEALAGMKDAAGPDGRPLSTTDRLRLGYEKLSAATADNPYLPNPFEERYFGALSKESEPVKLSEGEQLFRPDGKGGYTSIAGSPKGPKLGDVRKFSKGSQEISQEWDGSAWKDLGSGPRWQEENWIPDERGGISGQKNTRTGEWKPADMRPSTTVNNETKVPPQETEIEKYHAKRYQSIEEGADQANQMNMRLDRLGNLLEQVSTGKFGGTTLELKKAAKGVGVDLEKWGIADDAGPAEAAKSLANELALQLRNPAGGAGMPGAMSDKDREFLVSMVPGLETTAEGRRLMLETSRKLNGRSVEVARRARAYMASHGGKLDPGFYNELQDWSEQNPLFAGASVPTGDAPKPTGAPAGPPKAGDVVDGYRFKGGNPSDPKAWEPAQ